MSPGDEPVSLAVLTQRVADLDYRLDERTGALKEMMHTSNGFERALTTAQFVAFEKAVTKAEAALAEYKISANEFRAVLSDYGKLLVTRTEADAQFQAVEKKFDDLNRAIATIREWQNQGIGGAATSASTQQQGRWVIGTVLSAVTVGVSVVLYLLSRKP